MVTYFYSYSFKTIWFFLFILVSGTLSQRNKCPFNYLYHFGDGLTDIGNSPNVLPFGPTLPVTRFPYGITYPGRPDGRWCDGLIDIDLADFGVRIAPYLSKNATTTNGIIFSVALSTVLSPSFYASKGVIIPPSAVDLGGQMSWFKKYLKSICSTPADCRKRLADALTLQGDILCDDIGYALAQGKSIQEVESYIPLITSKLINTSRELINMGATRVIIPGCAPLGCFPYILTALPSNNPAAYDNLGCLNSVNNVVKRKNSNLQEAVNNLSMEFPNITVMYASYYDGVVQVLANSSITGPGNTSLKACCGIGGKYNYDSKRFCGSPGVPACPNPKEYIFWDGLHFTQEAYRRFVAVLQPPALEALNCTTS